MAAGRLSVQTSRFIYLVSASDVIDTLLISWCTSRSALKKYILANNANVSPGTAFDNQFNRAIKSGAEKQEFQLPKGESPVTPPFIQGSSSSLLVSSRSLRYCQTHEERSRCTKDREAC